MDFVDNNIQKVQVQPEDQVYARNEDIKVYGKLVSMSTENVVADSEQIWDEALKKNQSDINSQTQSKFGEYLPLTGGDIDGNLNVDGTVGLNGTLTLGDSLHIEEGNFAFEGENNESLTINFNGLTYAFTETDSKGFKIKEGDAQLNNITVIPKEHNDTDRSVSYVSPGMITIDDGSNAAHFTPTSIELSMSNDSVDTHVTAKTINTNEVLLTQSKAHGTQTVDTSITPGLIRLHQTPGGATHVTTIQPTGIISSMFQLADGTDQDVLLGDGSTTNRLIKDVTAGAIQSEYNFNFVTTGYVNKFVTIKAATSTTAGVMTAADKVKLDDIENKIITDIEISQAGGQEDGTLEGVDIYLIYAGSRAGKLIGISNATTTVDGGMSHEDKKTLDAVKNTYLPLSGGKMTGTLDIDFAEGIRIIENDLSPRNTYIGNGSIKIEQLDGDTSSVTSKTEIDSNSITTTNATVADKVKANGFLANNNGNGNTAWTTNGGSIDLINLLKNAAIYVYGGFERVEANVNNTTVIDNPDNIIFSRTGSFLAKKDSVYYTHWNADISKNIASPSRYGIETDNGVVPFNNQMYKFVDQEDIYIAICINGFCSMEKLTL